MTDETISGTSCADVEERMAEILEGSAPEPLYEHVAECDRCRDARYEAEKCRDAVIAAGADYVPPEDLEARLLGALDKRGDGGATGPITPATREPTGAPAASAPSGESSDRRVSHTERMALPQSVRSAEAERTAAGTAHTLPSTPTRTVAEEPAPTPPPAHTASTPAKTEPGPTGAPIPDPALREHVAERPRVLKLPSGAKRWMLLGGGGAAIAAAAGAALIIHAIHKKSGGDIAGEAWHGNVEMLAGPGLAVCSPDGKSCANAAEKGAVPAGSVLVTDGRTRARLTLADGTLLSLDRGTKISLGSDQGRRAKLETGTVVADVAHIEGKTARIDVPHGHVEVLGTKFSLSASEDSASVDVSRGVVKLADDQGREVTVRAGEEGRSYAGMPPYVSSAQSLGEAIAWSESAIAEGDSEEMAVRGLGELKAKKPGDSTERDDAVTLTSHSVKVRIAGAMARTEVDEVFTNSSSDTLEGIYRFPVPPDAKIERLALEVDGKMEEGAFVDRDRAAAIWRGAIVNVAPQLRPQIQDEIVWVPGPWRDPALLEWQRGGRFELRIYPIPKHGSRRVVLAYTQTIAPTGGVRRYNYPLAHDPKGSTKVGQFDVDVQVRGHDSAFGVRSRGYQLAKTKQGGADDLKLSQANFIPSGDLTVEYALPDRDAELTAWAYQPSADELSTQAKKASTPASAKDGKKDAEAATATPDDAPYVAIALRPKLPRSHENGRRTFALVVDSSRSMFGESYKHATAVAAKFVRELDPSDSFTLLACDAECRVMPGGMQTPGARAADESRRFLDGIVPEGASDPTAAIRAARTTVSSANPDELRIVYIGDGTPTVGAIRPAYVTRAVEEALPPGSGSLTTVAIGSDSDSDTLAAMARGGGGVMLPFVPGQTTAEAVYAALGATYGTTLRDVSVELPDGLGEVAPKKLDTFVSGGEEYVVARMSKHEVNGTVLVRGKLGKESFEQKYPVKIVATESKGNAFVPRLFAATRISDLERETSSDAKKEAIRLSSSFDVASRFTSLLVLESQAMFKAFGLDNTRTSHQWTGEETASGSTASGLNKVAEDEADDDLAKDDKSFDAPGGGVGSATRSAGPMADAESGSGFGGGGMARAPAKRPSPKPAATMAAPPMAAEEPAPPPAEKSKKEVARRPATTAPPRDMWQGRRRMVAMRRIWERKGSVSSGLTPPKNATPSAVAAAEREVELNGNRREAVRKLFNLLAISGDVDQARSVAERWSEKEPLDAEALTARADLAARSGDRENAIRILGSVVDVRPDDVKSQRRLARLHRWAGRPAVGCRNSLAIAQLRSGDAKLLAEAASCGRATGEARMVEDMLAAAEAKVRKAAESLISKFDSKKDELSGDLRVEGTWFSGDQDLDVALIDPDGNRISWLGAPTRSVISATDVTSTTHEGLAVRGAKAGEYVIEVVRANGGGTPVSGNLVVTVAGTKTTLPFTLTGNRTTVGIAKIRMESRLVPFNGGWGGWE
jgi:Vault protein inter-alpha-trypsin domain/FecR protein/von Willebrand factor type A domain